VKYALRACEIFCFAKCEGSFLRSKKQIKNKNGQSLGFDRFFLNFALCTLHFALKTAVSAVFLLSRSNDFSPRVTYIALFRRAGCVII
jgi:hypothetical protein